MTKGNGAKDEIVTSVADRKRKLRYRLHYQIRLEGFFLITKNKTIYHDYEKPLPDSKALDRLVKEFGYAIQLCYSVPTTKSFRNTK